MIKTAHKIVAVFIIIFAFMNRIWKFSKYPLISILWVGANIMLYLAMVYYDRQPDGDFFHEVLKKVLLISVIMQALYAAGFIKTDKK
ncbi:hypothetical protein [Dyadobacter diqingensis]|uniref:hypothetical protein n=1 Tax=Dyadobacter diqingensis TaxID=2938121 RepID=UPI0020C44E09|nr:hypothetical protein [Dyadobacter diqingensis]